MSKGEHVDDDEALVSSGTCMTRARWAASSRASSDLHRPLPVAGHVVSEVKMN